MSTYWQLVGSYISNFITQMGYLGDHLSSYPGIVFLFSFILVLGALGLLNRLINL